MNVHSQTVTEPMVKKTAETCLLDDEAGFGVDVVGLHARSDGGDSTLESAQNGSIDRLKLRSDLTCDQNARQVTFIRPARRSPIDQDKIVLADSGACAGARVRQSRVSANSNDRGEAGSRCAAAANIA